MRLPKILLEGDERLSAFRDRRGGAESAHVVVGWREWAGLPELGIARIAAKVDTGARTSALHADLIERVERDGAPFVRFGVTGEAAGTPVHEAPVIDRRPVKSSNGETEMRFVIRTGLALAGRVWPIELTLTKRDRMELPMLIGRQALAGRALVDAERSFVWDRPSASKRARRLKPAGG